MRTGNSLLLKKIGRSKLQIGKQRALNPYLFFLLKSFDPSLFLLIPAEDLQDISETYQACQDSQQE